LPGALPVAPPSMYFGVWGASGASMPGVLGGPSYEAPKSVKFNVLAPNEATFSKRILTALFHTEAHKILFFSTTTSLSIVSSPFGVVGVCLFLNEKSLVERAKEKVMERREASREPLKHNHSEQTAQSYPAAIIEPSSSSAAVTFYDSLLISLSFLFIFQ
jgi:hypothetical protein